MRFEDLFIVLMWSGRLNNKVMRLVIVKLVIKSLFGVKLVWLFIKLKLRRIKFVIILKKYVSFRVMFCFINFLCIVLVSNVIKI